MKRILIFIFLASAVFAVTCPAGCICLSEVEFVDDYNYTNFEDYFCQDPPVDCGWDALHEMPRFCFTIPPEVGSGDVDRGSHDPGDHSWYYDPNSNDIWNEMLQLRITAGLEEDIELKNIELQAFGTGDDENDIARIEVYLDLTSNGVVDSTDIKIGEAGSPYSQDDGDRTISLNLDIAAGSTKHIIIAYVMSPNAPVGETYGFTVNKMRATGEDSGVTFELSGLPKNSGLKTIVAPPPIPCSGNIILTLNQTTALPSAPIAGTVENITNCNRTIDISLDPCNFQVQSSPVCSCAVDTTMTGCSCDFTAPSQEGTYIYHACVDINEDNILNVGEAASAQLIVEEEEPVEEPPPECSSNDDCSDTQQCIAGVCTSVSGVCGYAFNHSWVTYECGEEIDCPVCTEPEICENNECVLYELEVPPEADLGEEVTAKLLRDGEAAPGRDITIEDPEDGETTSTTDESGEISFSPQFQGLYTLAFAKAGRTIASGELDVGPAATILDDVSRFFHYLSSEEPAVGLILVVIILAAIIYLWQRREAPRREEGEEAG